MSQLLEILDLTRLQVAIYHNARVCGNWIIHAHSSGNTCFHMPTQGSCRLEVPNIGEWEVNTGDFILFPREIPHTMTPITQLKGPQKHLALSEAQNLPGTSLICGDVHFQHIGNTTLLDALPKVLIIRKSETDGWLEHLLSLILQESLLHQEHSNPIINHLCELLFSYALRHYSENYPLHSGFFALLSHKQLSKTINVIHKKPAQNWQLSTLARQAGMSRTLFSQTFKKVSGWTPIQYLTWWRMQLAWSLLKEGHQVSYTAEKVGYQSEAAFSRTFKKQFEMNPSKIRSR